MTVASDDECATCGLQLDGDPDDEPDGDAGLPICGDCNRNRNFAALEEVVLWEGSAE
jgi:hypothetical protein